MARIHAPLLRWATAGRSHQQANLRLRRAPSPGRQSIGEVVPTRHPECLGKGPTVRKVPLDAAAARRVYDRIGRFQDSQGFYEDAATHRLVELADFDECASVFELGCGTGRFAAHLLATAMPTTANYLGVDISPKMVSLARRRLGLWKERAPALLIEPPGLQLPAGTGSVDRFISTYVFDLLSPGDAQALLSEARRLLKPGGLLGLVSLTHGTTPGSRIFSSCWGAIAERLPCLVGGCRPVDLGHLVSEPAWSIEYCEVLVTLMIPSQILVARRQG
jgi:ubiquinone/menaquinone biosynthesis C-methylase UbiE